MIQGLDNKIPIVNPDGTPTLYLLQLLQGRGGNIQGAVDDAADALTQVALKADKSILLTAGSGLSGGGDLSANRSFALNAGIDLLTDVDTSTTPPTNGQALVYETASSLWKPGTVSGGGGAKSLISEVVTSGSATNVSFASIPATYRDLELRVRGRGTKVANGVDIRIRFNGDTAANYDSIEHDFTFNPGGVVGGGGTYAGTSGLVGYLAAASATASSADDFIADICNYRDTTWHKRSRSFGSVKYAASNNNMFNVLSSVYWRKTAAISQIDVFPSSNAFVDNTVVSLYGHL